MAAKKKAGAKAGASRIRNGRAARAAAAAATQCPKCDRELQLGESIEYPERGCIRCHHGALYPGRDYDADAAAAIARGINVSSYVREQLEPGYTAKY